MPTARLTTVYRADSQWAGDAWAALRAGATAEALAAYADRGLVLVAPDRAAARALAVERWDRDRRALAERGLGVEELLLTTDGTRAEVQDLNRRAQAARLAAGELQGEPVPIGHAGAGGAGGPTDVALAWPGDRVVTIRPVHGVPLFPGAARPCAGSRTARPARSSPPTPAPAPWPCGSGTGSGASPQEQSSALELGYAQHLYRAQGRTVTEVLVCGGGWQTDRESGYVGVTRARETSVVVTDADVLGGAPEGTLAALRALASSWTESHPPVAATTLVEQAARAEAAPEAVPTDEFEASVPPPAPGPPREPGWTIVDEPDRGRERG